MRIKEMPQEPELISPSLPANAAPEPGLMAAPGGPGSGLGPGPGAESAAGLGVASGHGPHRLPRWLEKSELYLRVILRMYIGLAVCYAPWSHTFWDQNPLFLQFPTLSIYAANGAVRGVVSGLGLLNLWIAFHSAVRHGTEEG